MKIKQVLKKIDNSFRIVQKILLIFEISKTKTKTKTKKKLSYSVCWIIFNQEKHSSAAIVCSYRRIKIDYMEARTIKYIFHFKIFFSILISVSNPRVKPARAEHIYSVTVSNKGRAMIYMSIDCQPISRNCGLSQTSSRSPPFSSRKSR